MLTDIQACTSLVRSLYEQHMQEIRAPASDRTLPPP
jgi:hypothetical protein